VDEIVCISVNDTFVMNEWAKDQDAEHVTLLPDGNGEFTGKMFIGKYVTVLALKAIAGQTASPQAFIDGKHMRTQGDRGLRGGGCLRRQN
jgi:hypothetical protein